MTTVVPFLEPDKSDMPHRFEISPPFFMFFSQRCLPNLLRHNNFHFAEPWFPWANEPHSAAATNSFVFDMHAHHLSVRVAESEFYRH